MSNPVVSIAVRPLVEYVFRGGDLDLGGFRTAQALVEGTRAHQQVQREYGEGDEKEVYVSAEIPWGDLLFAVDGRCDGLLREADGTLTVDEIKSTSGDLTLIAEDTYPVHWAQAKCYAYIVAKDRGLTQMNIQLTYVQLPSGDQKRFLQTAAFAELEAFVQEVVRSYAPFAKMLRDHRQARDRSVAELAFPFPAYRAGQRMLAGAVYKTIAENVNLFAKAPTGIGKTISTTFPAVKAMGEGHLQHLFYLTARTITRTAAEEAFALMESRGLHLHTVTITAKEKVCLQDEMSCRKEDCPFADGFYDRINGAVLDILSQETRITRQVIERYARKHTVCPFEFSLELAYAADAVICDYNYVFDPRVSLKRLFAEQKNRTALLVDEAHNLVDRGREMYSAVLEKAGFLALQRAYKGVNAGVHRAAKAVNGYFIALRKKIEGPHRVDRDKPEDLLALLEEFILQAEPELASPGPAAAHPEDRELLLQAYFNAQAFVRIGKLYDERYVTYAEDSPKDVRIKMFCLDPSYLLREARKGFRSSIFFSATLSPLPYYRDMLGAGPEDYTVTIPSPFSREQLDVQIHPLSTRYRDREQTKDALAGLLRRAVAERPPGNYLFFFPSYAYMNLIYEAFAAEGPEGVRLLVQRGEMSEAEREAFLAAFEAGREDTLVGFAVMGGIFSEGIDLVGDRLTGVAVVGVGLPQIGLERDIIKEYFQAQGKDGFDYAYVYPGMNKVLQAGGRLIRSEKDQGVLLLVDDRYRQPHYARLLPEEWS
ncbi:ATP-dependent DNA helicase [Paenibacillus sp. alder61]|uniref:ATP-dependent DNA helicase n=1 Tax=Paenibacillus sp. alder61 TaxID=2862948 RepID=UPI001CD670E9|nr:ATP-dependent DNA helicase [Paenibacillus sp. alder61]MCA1293429.1 ATP-dependent DNA helicase [Paenibacillus sp. alder61]